MKKFSIATAVAILVVMTTSAFASCDTHGDDDQAACASKCDEAYQKDQEDRKGSMGDMSKVKENKKACDEKCGCPQNSMGL